MSKGEDQRAEFIGRVVGDPNNPQPARLLTGWLGDAAEESYRRLYTDAELSSYVDIPDDAVLHTEPIRDMQPAGAVFVWIKADAAVRQGGSAASRASRFLQGKVQQDFSSPEKAGFRCVTQQVCGEPTGFTGECTKQPEVGGAWPCITSIPLCAEPTGFTGQCTQHPWPNPTRYFGCTVVHCPTHDLTHNPHICNMVASGLPQCGGGAIPQDGVNEQPGAAAAEGQNAAPATHIPGCGYTKTWGLCETHLLGCGGATDVPKCAPSVDRPCITYDAACEPAGVGPYQDGGGTGGGQVGGPPPSVICATSIACWPTSRPVICFPSIACPAPSRVFICPLPHTFFRPNCPVKPWPPKLPFDPQVGPGGFPGPVRQQQQFGAAGGGQVGPTGWLGCTTPPHCFGPSGYQGCATASPAECLDGPTAWLGCTMPPQCPDSGQQAFAAAPQQNAGYDPAGGQFGGPQPSIFFACPSKLLCPPSAICPQPSRLVLCRVPTIAEVRCRFTIVQPQCQYVPPLTLTTHTWPPVTTTWPGPTDPITWTRNPAGTQFPGGAIPHQMQQFGAAGGEQVGHTGWQGCTMPPQCPDPGQQQVGPTGWFGCTTPPQCVGPTGWQGCTAPPHCFGPTGYQGCEPQGEQPGAPQQPFTPVTTCTQVGPQCQAHITLLTQPVTQCPPHNPQPFTPATVCTQFGPQCPHVTLLTQPVTQCPPHNPQPFTPVTICTQFGPNCQAHNTLLTQPVTQCPPHNPQPFTPVTICTQFGPNCQAHNTLLTQPVMHCPPPNPQPVTPATVCTQFGPQCPTHHTLLTQPVTHCPSAIPWLCPGGGHVTGNWPTPATHCFIC